MITTTRQYHRGTLHLFVFRNGVEIAKHKCKGVGDWYYVQGAKGVEVLREDEIRKRYVELNSKAK